MPSNHAQFMGYICGNVKELTKLIWLPDWIVRIIILILVILVPISRVYLEYHYKSQVLIGLTLGYLFAISWHKLMLFACQYYPQINHKKEVKH